MKKYYFSVFIVLLGLFVAYAFYAFWHMPGTTSHGSAVKLPSKTSPKNLATKEMIPKSPSTIDQNTKILPPSDTDSHPDEKKGDPVEVGERIDTPPLAPQKQQAQTESIYSTLTPEEHEETMEAASEAFEELDTQVDTADDQLAQEMEEAETNRAEEQEEMANEEDGAGEDIMHEPDTEEPPSLPENDEGNDVTKEDVNNP